MLSARLAGFAAARATRLVSIFCSGPIIARGEQTLVNHNAIQKFVAGAGLLGVAVFVSSDGQESIAEVVMTEPSRSGNRSKARPKKIKFGLTVDGVYRQLSLATCTTLRLMRCASIST